LETGLLKPEETKVILDAIREGLVAVNAEGKITIFNRAAQRLMRIPAARALGRPVVDVIPNTRLQVVLETGVPELDQQQQLGQVAIITNRVPVLSRTGQIVGAVAVFRDISEVIALAEEVTSLKATRELLQAIINATQDAISVVDEQGMGILINPAYTRLTGLTEADVLHQPATVDIAEGESVHLKVLSTGKPFKSAAMKVGPGKRDVLVDVAPIIIGDQIKGSVGVIHDVSEIRRLSEELEHTRSLLRRLSARYTFADIIGQSPAIARAKEQALMAAATPATVLLRGESGTGKELFAHAIHQASGRARGPFVRVNCAAIAPGVLESELFGYEEGSFTGAKKGGRRGYFEEAGGGTIFLDEVGAIEPGTQTKLLRVLQEKEVLRVGSNEPVPVDVRVIAATNANLEDLMRRGLFRQDLFYRLSVVPIAIPSLRERSEDIPLLAEALVRKLNQEYGRSVEQIEAAALELLLQAPWPGNVRELENAIGRGMIALEPGQKSLQARHLSFLVPGTVVLNGSKLAGEGLRYHEAKMLWEREFLKTILDSTGGNRTEAAARLGISIRSLYNKIKTLQLD